MRALSRKYANRKSLLRNLATSLVLYEQIKTTQAKAKEIKPIIEQLINRAKSGSLSDRRFLLGYFFDENATKKVFEVLVPRYSKIKSGYVKTYKLGNRLGDAAPIMMLKLVNNEEPVKVEEKIDNKEGKDGKENAVQSKEQGSSKTKVAKPGKTGRSSAKNK